MISTLVAGIDALSGSKSPIDAMFKKLLFILSKIVFLSFSRFQWSSPLFYERGRRTEAEKKLCARLPGEKWSKGARERERKRVGDVMSPLFLLLSLSPPLSFSRYFTLFHLRPFCASLASPSPFCLSLTLSIQCSSVDFCSVHLKFSASDFTGMEVMSMIQSPRKKKKFSIKSLSSVCVCVCATTHFPCPQYSHSHQFNSVSFSSTFNSLWVSGIKHPSLPLARPD